MADPKRNDVRRLALASASSPLNVIVGATGVAAGSALGALTAGGATLGAAVVSLGVLAYGALIALDLQNPKFAARQVEKWQQAGGPPEPDPVALNAIASLELRESYGRIRGGYDRVRRSFDASNPSLRGYLEPTMALARQLLIDAGRTAVKGNPLYTYLVSERSDQIDVEMKKLEASAARATDPQAAASYGKAVAAMRDKLSTHTQIEGLYDRVRAQLAAVDSTLVGMHAKMVKLQATDLEEAAVVNNSISANLEALSVDLHGLDSAMEEILQEIAR